MSQTSERKMFDRMKYIIIDTGLNYLPVVFSEIQQHGDVASAFYATKEKIIGAGFCKLKTENVNGRKEPRFVCFGHSTSLNVQSRGEKDSEFLNKYLGVLGD